MTYPYLIVGGGMAAHAAVEGIRSIDGTAPIAVLSAERHPPYRRPPLSKGLWRDPTASIQLDSARDVYDLFLEKYITQIDPVAKVVRSASGERFGYHKLLIATGSRPRTLPGLPPGGPVIAYRTLDDYRRTRELAHAEGPVTVVGGGFIGCEMAAAMVLAGAEVTWVFREDQLGARRFPSGLADAIMADYVERGVLIRANRSVRSTRVVGPRVTLTLDECSTVESDLIILGLGTQPNTELAASIDLPVQGGIHVDRYLRTPHPDIYAAGDVAAFLHPALHRRIRVEHEDAAVSMGRHAGRVMAGLQEPYRHIPFFYGDLFDNGYEAVGILNARLQTRAVWMEPFHKGIVYYHDGARLNGVLLFNTWGSVDEARDLLRRGEAIDVASLGADLALR